MPNLGADAPVLASPSYRMTLYPVGAAITSRSLSRQLRHLCNVPKLLAHHRVIGYLPTKYRHIDDHIQFERLIAGQGTPPDHARLRVPLRKGGRIFLLLDSPRRFLERRVLCKNPGTTLTCHSCTGGPCRKRYESQVLLGRDVGIDVPPALPRGLLGKG